MKYVILAVVALGLLTAAVWFGIETGYRAGMERLCAYQHGTMVLSIKALGEMRQGDTNAINTIQSLGFQAALYVLDSCSDTVSTNLPSFQSLSLYRQTYRTNSAQWTPAEHKLEQALAERFGLSK